MAAGEATLSELTPDVYSRMENRAERLEEGLRQAGVSVVRIGSLLTVFFRDRAPANFREAKESDTEAFARLFHLMRGAGVLLPPSQFEAWFVSAAHDDDVIDATLDAASS
jgi:glutamate-1-semialdehyde 2,1-aminomutase